MSNPYSYKPAVQFFSVGSDKHFVRGRKHIMRSGTKV